MRRRVIKQSRFGTQSHQSSVALSFTMEVVPVHTLRPATVQTQSQRRNLLLAAPCIRNTTDIPPVSFLSGYQLVSCPRCLVAGLLTQRPGFDFLPIPVAERSKANVCGRLFVGVAGSNPGAVGLGTAPQAGRSWVRFPMGSLRFLIKLVPPAALWSWGRLSL